MPAQDRLGPNDLGHFLQGFSSQALADFSQRDALGIAQPQATLDLASENPVLGDEVFVAQKEFLID
ncbi:MAG: hypothetical protein U1G07_15030 [Verrucomicrobiota bacterium]